MGICGWAWRRTIGGRGLAAGMVMRAGCAECSGIAVACWYVGGCPSAAGGGCLPCGEKPSAGERGSSGDVPVLDVGVSCGVPTRSDELAAETGRVFVISELARPAALLDESLRLE